MKERNKPRTPRASSGLFVGMRNTSSRAAGGGGGTDNHGQAGAMRSSLYVCLISIPFGSGSTHPLGLQMSRAIAVRAAELDPMLVD